MALRGYAMGQVDDVLERLAREIAERDATDRRADRRRRPADRTHRAPRSPRSRSTPTTTTEPVSVRLEAAAEVAAPVTRVWDELVDWAGQSRWIPFTTVRIVTDHDAGLGVRAAALSGFWLGRLPSACWTGSWSPAGRRRARADGSRGRARGAAPRAVLHRRGVFALRGHETAPR